MPSPVATEAVTLGVQKLAQARAFLKECSLDAWLLAVRESKERPDPNLRFFLDLEFTWNSYFLVTLGRSYALVATLDAPDLQRAGVFDEVRTYKEGSRDALIQLLGEAKPSAIGINVSQDDALADGLTAGLRDHIVETLKGTPYAERFQSAEKLLSLIRGVKLPTELSLIRAAVEETERIFDRAGSALRVGMTAREIAAVFHREAAALGASTAWVSRQCPAVTVGARSPIGHVAPGDEPVGRGCIVHVDFGIVRDGFCSDLQRLWYVTGPSDPVLFNPLP